MNNIQINPVCPADAPFLTILMNHPVLLSRLHQSPTTQADWEEAIALWLSGADEEGYILFEGSQPIGWFALNSLLSPKPYLKIAVLLPEYQGRGIGQLALSRLLQSLRSAGFRSVGLFTDCDNSIAQACYQKCGFRVIRTTRETWPDGSTNAQYEMEVIL